MRIDKISLKNFRGYESLEVEFHPRFNVITGGNGTGKTTLLEALKIAIGGLLSGMRLPGNEIGSFNIQKSEDVRHDFLLDSPEPQFPTHVKAEGIVDGEQLTWDRYVISPRNNTQTAPRDIVHIGDKMRKEYVQKGKGILPLFAYYSTGRIQLERAKTQAFKKESRLAGYFNALSPSASSKYFTSWMQNEALIALQEGIPQSPGAAAVEAGIKSCLPECEGFYYDAKSTELVARINGEKIPLRFLSDGMRTVASMVADLTFRAFLLNPTLQADAAQKTPGIVLIDELDLHLHPTWQQRIVKDLIRTFPDIQFITTTHAPMILSGTPDRVIRIINRTLVQYYDQYTYGRDANEILNTPMGSSSRNEAIEKRLALYFNFIEEGQGLSEQAKRIRNELEQQLGKDYHEFAKADTMLLFYS